MSPNSSTQATSAETASPWTDCYQSNPVHSNGDYATSDPRQDESQSPTWEALTNIYDPTTRE
jgi:hypothetical protein